jgi:hypothetical protein
MKNANEAERGVDGSSLAGIERIEGVEDSSGRRHAIDHAIYEPGPVPEGLKFDGGKLPYELLPDDAIEEVVKVLQFGAKKYAPRNWEKGIVFSRLYGAIRRHGVAWFKGEDNDPETGISHLAHLATEALFALAFAIRKTKNVDDRPCKMAA